MVFSTILSFAQSQSFLTGSGIVLIIAAIVIIAVMKKIIINSILGVVAWAIVIFVLKIQLPFIPSLVISVIFGLAGVGSLILLKIMEII